MDNCLLEYLLTHNTQTMVAIEDVTNPSYHSIYLFSIFDMTKDLINFKSIMYKVKLNSHCSI